MTEMGRGSVSSWTVGRYRKLIWNISLEVTRRMGETVTIPELDKAI